MLSALAWTILTDNDEDDADEGVNVWMEFSEQDIFYFPVTFQEKLV